MFLSPVEYYEINKIIKNLKKSLCYGIHELPTNWFKNCADELTLTLTFLINQSFEKGVFPYILKTAILKPVHKKDEKYNPCNYRPTALLPKIQKYLKEQ